MPVEAGEMRTAVGRADDRSTAPGCDVQSGRPVRAAAPIVFFAGLVAVAVAISLADPAFRASTAVSHAIGLEALVACAATGVGALLGHRLAILRPAFYGAAKPQTAGAGEPPADNRGMAGAEDAGLAAALDRASIGFYVLDRAGRFVIANRTFARWLGTEPSEIVESGARLHDVLVKGPRVGTPPWDALGDGEIMAGNAVFGTRDKVAAECRVEQRVSGAGAALRACAIVHRLPDQRDAAGAARSGDRFGRFFANAPVGIAIVDRAGIFLAANRSLGDLFDAAADGLTGRTLGDFLNVEDGAAVRGKLAAAATGGADRTPLELRLRSPSERTIVLLLSPSDTAPGRGAHIEAAPEQERAGSPAPPSQDDPVEAGDAAAPGPGFTLYFIDVTEQKQLETQFAQSQKMQAVGQLAGGVAHDFNNLLTAMSGFCDLLLLRSRPGDPAFADIMQIKQNANRAANLVRQLLAFSRQQSLQPRVLDITDVLAELSHLLRRLIGENIELEFAHAPDLGLIKVDQGQLEQVVINLAVNARDAMPEGGRLTIRTANAHQTRAVRRGHETLPAGDYVLIEVADTGAGIAPDHLPRIFEPFFSTKQIGSGTGLGLSTVYGIVRQTGGFVFVDSAPGRGTAFAIYLPRHQSAAPVNLARPDIAEPALLRDLTGTATVMLVEDDDAVRMFGARALRNKGYRVIEAKSGEAALELVHNAVEPIELVITDVVMPQMDGPALIRELRNIAPDIKVIFISGYAEDTFRQRLDSDSGIHFLAKPFSLKQLAVKVKDVIGGELRGPLPIACGTEQIGYNIHPASRCAAAPAVE